VNEDKFKGNWKQLKGSIQAKWGEHNDDELEEIDGDREKLEGKIQEKYGKSKEEAREEVERVSKEWG